MLFEISIVRQFSAAHQLQLPDRSLEPLHGHSYPPAYYCLLERKSFIEKSKWLNAVQAREVSSPNRVSSVARAVETTRRNTIRRSEADASSSNCDCTFPAIFAAR
jgi:hypothetical protein